MLEPSIDQLQQDVSETRAQRMAAQKKALQLPVLEQAVQRLDRDRSSGTTKAITDARQEIQTLTDEILAAVSGLDHNRVLFKDADKVYGNISHRENMANHLNADARWRTTVMNADTLIIALPLVEEIV